MRYYSKKDWWLGLLLWVPMVAAILSTGYTVVVANKAHFVLAILTLMLGFIVWIWFSTYYVIDKKNLYLKCGPIVEKIPYEKIKSIKNSHNLLSSLALSMDRIEIRYGDGGLTLISPQNKDDFLKELIKKCPKLDIEHDNLT